MLKSLVVLVTLVLSFLAPFYVHVPASAFDEGERLLSFNICDTSDSFITVSADAPSLHETPCRPMPFEIGRYIETVKPSFNPFLYVIKLEHPPRS